MIEINLLQRICTKCNKERILKQFGSHSKGKYGRQPSCRKCAYETNRKFCTEHPEIKYEWDRKYKTTHPDNRKRYARDWARRNKMITKERRLELKYGLSTSEYLKMMANQSNVCAICKHPPSEKEKILHVDHDHRTNKVRGLLCGSCNRALGLFDDSMTVVMDAYQYLQKHYDPVNT